MTPLPRNNLSPSSLSCQDQSADRPSASRVHASQFASLPVGIKRGLLIFENKPSPCTRSPYGFSSIVFSFQIPRGRASNIYSVLIYFVSISFAAPVRFYSHLYTLEFDEFFILRNETVDYELIIFYPRKENINSLIDDNFLPAREGEWKVKLRTRRIRGRKRCREESPRGRIR